MIFNSDNYKIVHQGIDTLVLGVNCTNEEYFKSKYQQFISTIANLKIEAQSLNTFGEKYILSDLGLSYGDFKISSKGLGQYFGYISNDDIFCLVSDTKFNSKVMYHLKIQFRSSFLLKYGHEYCFSLVNRFLNDIFQTHYYINVLRLDIATDVTGIKYTPQDFLKFRSLKKISNYTDHTFKDDFLIDEDEDKQESHLNLTDVNVNNFMRFTRFEGISFGKSPLMFRVYDKIKQVTEKQISKLIFTKWKICGFDLNRDMFVFRHEVEFGRFYIKKLIPDTYKHDEISYIFNHLSAFWSYGLSSCRWYDLTDNEVNRLTESNILFDSRRKVYQRCENDLTRLKFWDMINVWDDENNKALLLHKNLITPDLSKPKKALKAFISSVYSNMGYEHNNFLIVLDEVIKDLQNEGLTLHEYGLNKLASNFNNNQEAIKQQSLDLSNPLSFLCFRAVDDFIMALKNVRNEDYKRNIKKSLLALKEMID